MSELTEPESVWLACAIDGEGSITTSLNWYNGKPSFRPRILVYNTNLSFIKEAERLFGTNMKTQNPNITTNQKPEYQARLHKRQRIVDVLEQIFPYLIIKKEEAEVVIAWCKHRLKWYNKEYDVKDYEYYLVLKSLNSAKGKTVKEVGEEFILKIRTKCTYPNKYVNLVNEATKNLEV